MILRLKITSCPVIFWEQKTLCPVIFQMKISKRPMTYGVKKSHCPGAWVPGPRFNKFCSLPNALHNILLELQREPSLHVNKHTQRKIIKVRLLITVSTLPGFYLFHSHQLRWLHFHCFITTPTTPLSIGRINSYSAQNFQNFHVSWLIEILSIHFNVSKRQYDVLQGEKKGDDSHDNHLSAFKEIPITDSVSHGYCRWSTGPWRMRYWMFRSFSPLLTVHPSRSVQHTWPVIFFFVGTLIAVSNGSTVFMFHIARTDFENFYWAQKNYSVGKKFWK